LLCHTSNLKNVQYSKNPLTNQPSLRLNGKNYLKWSHFVQTFLKGKDKLGDLIDNPPQSLDPKFAAWDEADAVVLLWLWNAMTPELSDAYMFMKTTRRKGIVAKQIIPKLVMLPKSTRLR